MQKNIRMSVWKLIVVKIYEKSHLIMLIFFFRS